MQLNQGSKLEGRVSHSEFPRLESSVRSPRDSLRSSMYEQLLLLLQLQIDLRNLHGVLPPSITPQARRYDGSRICEVVEKSREFAHCRADLVSEKNRPAVYRATSELIPVLAQFAADDLAWEWRAIQQDISMRDRTCETVYVGHEEIYARLLPYLIDISECPSHLRSLGEFTRDTLVKEFVQRRNLLGVQLAKRGQGYEEQ